MDTTRHVISTTLTTIGGFMPLIVIVGGDFWPSMSIVLAGGITGASIMALVFIPAAYRLLRRWVAISPRPAERTNHRSINALRHPNVAPDFGGGLAGERVGA